MSQYVQLTIGRHDLKTDDSDYLSIYDGTNDTAALFNQLIRYSVSNQMIYTSTQQFLYVRFKSDGWQNRGSFSVSYQTTATGELLLIFRQGTVNGCNCLLGIDTIHSIILLDC